MPGQDWHLEIDGAVFSSDVILVFLSKRAITKAGYVQREIRQALEAADKQPEATILRNTRQARAVRCFGQTQPCAVGQPF